MKRALVALFLILSSLPLISSAEELNAGFVQGIWYSEGVVFAENPTRIYVALRNNTPHDLTGTVRFTDNGKRIGSSPISALSGRLVEAWVDWTPTPGEHIILASVTDAELHIIGEGTKSIDISGIVAEDTLTVDTDTDADGTGNEIDTDDDNDGVSDSDEKARGTDSLKANPVVVTKSPDDEPEEKVSVPKTATPAETESEQGIEKYLDAGVVASALGNVTEKVEGAKHSLDTYRGERNAELYTKNDEEVTTGSENAIITRSSIGTKNNFLSSFVAGVASLLANIWTFILWALSQTLAYPALIQFLILLSMLYILYRIIRRVARRPTF